MREVFILTAHLLVTLAKLARPGGLRAVAAESLAVKHQLLIMKRSRQRAPNLTSRDRLTLGFCALFVSRERLSKMAVILKASTLLYFHQALVKRKYYLLYNSVKRHCPGPKGPSKEMIDAVVEMKRRNPRFGCRKIAEQISSAFGIEINKDVVRRILIRHYRSVPGGDGPSWLTVIGHAKDSLTPVSHPFVERLIGTVRREYLDRTLFWNRGDLERKLDNYKAYYNQHRCHTGLGGATPAERSGVPAQPIAKLESYTWRQHCNGLFQTPTAA